ncbi:MAG: hypothetical protein ACJ8DY_01850, partial [Xanthobacteraceae bacterium]
ELRNIAPTARLRTQIDDLASMAGRLDAEPKYSVNFFLDPNVEQRLSVLNADWQAPAGSRAATLIAALRKSAEIFGYYRRANAGEPVGLYNNTVREEWLKAQFRLCYERSSHRKSLPKMMFKMGANHLYHGLNATYAFPVGNLAHEFAIMNGMEGFGIMAVTFSPGRGYQGQPEWLKALLPSDPPTRPTLINLRPLRPAGGIIRRQRKVEDVQSFRQVLYGYDALMIFPNAPDADMQLSGLKAP